MKQETVTRLFRLTLGLGLLLLVGAALAANGVPVPGFGDLDPDFRAWFSSPAALALTVGVFVGYLRTWLKLEGNAVRLVGLGVGVALAAFGAAIGELERDFVTVVLFGLMAGIAAGGGWDILSGLVAVVAKVFGVVFVSAQGEVKDLPAATASPVTPTRTVVIEKNEKASDVEVNVEVKRDERNGHGD